MTLAQMINKDEEIQKLKAQYKEKTGKYPPPYCIDTHKNIQEYKNSIKELVKHLAE